MDSLGLQAGCFPAPLAWQVVINKQCNWGGELRHFTHGLRTTTLLAEEKTISGLYFFL